MEHKCIAVVSRSDRGAESLGITEAELLCPDPRSLPQNQQGDRLPDLTERWKECKTQRMGRNAVFGKWHGLCIHEHPAALISCTRSSRHSNRKGIGCYLAPPRKASRKFSTTQEFKQTGPAKSCGIQNQRNPNSKKSPLSRAPSASAAWAGGTPGPRPLPGRRPRPRVPKMRKLPAFVVLLLRFFCGVLAKSVRVHAAELQNVQQSPSEGKCQPGFHMSDEHGCVPCMEGIEYTSYANSEPVCLKCTICKADEDEIAKCTSTQDTKCQCKPGTFKDENSPEFCQKCSECTDEQSEKASCTPKTNRICVPKDSGHNLDVIIGSVVPGLLLLLFFAGVVVWKCGVWGRALQLVKRTYPGREQHSENSVPLTELRTSNPENGSPAMKASEEPEEAPDSPTEAEPLVPANGIDPVDGQPPVADGPHRQ